ncbi:hypothetical protein [Mesorhizobium sp. M0767]|uniref:hypothetical protein n=1 Tax=Mesorhizobium sp. M0767 TaxID=2956995 RepID=UPI0033366D1F
MNTVYLADQWLAGIVGSKRTSRLDPRAVELEREPEGDDMPVFERAASGYRGEYDRPYRADEDRVTMRRLKPWARY